MAARAGKRVISLDNFYFVFPGFYIFDSLPQYYFLAFSELLSRQVALARARPWLPAAAAGPGPRPGKDRDTELPQSR